MPKITRYGLEQGRAQLPYIAAEAAAGYSSVLTRHGKPVAAVVPFAAWQDQQQAAPSPARQFLALRGTGQGLWPQGARRAVAELREEW